MIRKADHLRSNFLLAYPVMLSMLGQVMTGVADSIMVGWTGAAPLAASSFANTFFSVTIMFGIGVSYGITPLVAKAAGKGDHGEATTILRHGTVVNLVTGVLLTAFLYAIVPAMKFMGQPVEVTRQAIPYLCIIAPSVLPTMIFQTYRQFGEGLQHTRVAMVVVIGSNLLNILLNYLLIFGKMGFPALGLEGAGWATLVSRIVMGLAMALYVYHHRFFLRYRDGFRLLLFSRPQFMALLHIGIPAGLQFIMEGGAFGASAIMMGWHGTIPLAAHQVALNLATISYMTTSGLGAAATIKAGRYFGRLDRTNLIASANILFLMAAVVMAAWAILFIVGRHFLPGMYTDDPAVIEVASGLMIISAFFQISDGLQVVCAGALRGLQDVKIPVLLIFVAYWVIALPVGYVLSFPFGLGPIGIWIGLLSGLTLTAIAMLWRFRRLSVNVGVAQV